MSVILSLVTPWKLAPWGVLPLSSAIKRLCSLGGISYTSIARAIAVCSSYRAPSDVASPEGCLVEIISVQCSSRDRRVSRSDRLGSDEERGSAGGAAAGTACAVSR